MTPDARLAYLEALGIPLWVRREKLAAFSPAPASAIPGTVPETAVVPAAPVARKPRSVRLSPGEGPGLLICAGPGEASGALAGDLGRTLGGQPAWAWPDSGNAAQPVEDASKARMFTALVVFGAGLARTIFGGKPPVSCGAARVVVAPSMAELKSNADARRECWRVLRESGVITAP